MRLEHHLVGGYVRYISPYIIIIIIGYKAFSRVRLCCNDVIVLTKLQPKFVIRLHLV